MFSKRCIAALTIAALAATAGTASAAGPADEGAPSTTAASVYREAFPQMTQAQAQAAADQQDERKSLYAPLNEDGGITYGGSWFDPPSGILHIALTTQAAVDRAVALSHEKDIDVQTHLVGRSFASLERQADAIRTGSGPLRLASTGQVGIDVKTNKVVVAVPAAQKAVLTAAGQAAGVTVIADPKLRVQADACAGRNVCDGSIAAGAMLWRGGAGAFVCSVGFTAEDPFTLGRFVYTAGHCSNGIGVNWGTGAQQIGPLLGSLDLNDIDASVIGVTNALYTGQPGGRLYNTDDVDAVAPTLASIAIGDVVCNAANFQDPTGSRFCGVIGSTSDPAVRGMVRVDNEDACPGDSGGTWYELNGGIRTGYGVHSRSSVGCHGDAGGSQSWFSALPTIKSGFAPGYNVETR
jgi:streptogrisin C